MIELLAGGGRPDHAFASWHSACAVIVLRLPSTATDDVIDILYDHEADSAGDALAEAAVGRMNHYLLQEKRIATAGVALLARHSPKSVGVALQLATSSKAPPSTLIALLGLMKEFEPAPYEGTQVAARELLTIASGDLVSARTLARLLLERAGLPAPFPPPLADLTPPPLSEARTAELIKGIGPRRIERVMELWPEYGERVAGKLDQKLGSDDLKKRMQAAMRQLDPGHKGRNISVWMPLDEDIEKILQTTGVAVRSALARRGILDPRVEEEVGLRLIADTEIGVRIALSRIVRPGHIPAPSSLSPGSRESEVEAVLEDEHAGWIIAGIRETELIIGEGYDNPLRARIEVFSGLVSATARDDRGLPFGYGQSALWRSLPSLGTTS